MRVWVVQYVLYDSWINSVYATEEGARATANDLNRQYSEDNQNNGTHPYEIECFEVRP